MRRKRLDGGSLMKGWDGRAYVASWQSKVFITKQTNKGPEQIEQEPPARSKDSAVASKSRAQKKTGQKEKEWLKPGLWLKYYYPLMGIFKKYVMKCEDQKYF